MCGICGSTAPNPGDAVQAMNEAMRHRGPDDDGVLVDERSMVAIGARRLSIIDVAGGHQPLRSEDGTVWAALNGEIYNHPALSERLLSRGHRLSSGCDTEVIVHLYEEYGDDLVHALEGMFSLVVWDARRQRLLLARDRFGEKPLFYSETGGQLRFASQLDALRVGVGSALDELDRHAVDELLTFGYVGGPRTITAEARQLPPASLLSWERARPQARVRTYWAPPAAPRELAVPFEELVAETGELLRRSVRSRLLSDVPLGVFLSGGVDSTLVASLAAKASARRLETFTVGYGSPDHDETAAARRCAELIGSEHHELQLTDEMVARTAPGLLARMDQPIADQSLVAMHALAVFARQRVTVAIGGEGADELFGGYGRYRWMSRAERIGQVLPPELGRIGAAILKRHGGGRALRAAEVLTPRLTRERHIEWVTDGRRDLRATVYGPQLLPVLATASLSESTERRLDAAVDADLIGAYMRLDQRHWLPDDVLAKADRASMLASLELRTPFLHRELAELAALVPSSMHVRHGGKSVLRELLRRECPNLQLGRKRGFMVPASHWLRGPLAPAMHEQLRSGTAYQDGWLAHAPIVRMFAEHRAGTRDWSAQLWPALSFGLWLDRFSGADVEHVS